MKRLTLFDLDHTLLTGDSDVLWCEFLMQRGALDRASFAQRNREMEIRYQSGTVPAREFCEFYVSTMAGRNASGWHGLRQDFLDEVIARRIPATARALVRQHQQAGDLVLMSTATNRVITELTAAHLGIEHLLATECEVSADGTFSGRVEGTPNMREGKVARLHTWLAARGEVLASFETRFYSDSINDLPLLLAVQYAVVVDPEPRLRAEAATRGWPVLSLR